MKRLVLYSTARLVMLPSRTRWLQFVTVSFISLFCVYLIIDWNLMDMFKCVSINGCLNNPERTIPVKIVLFGKQFEGPWHPEMADKTYIINNVICDITTGQSEARTADAVVFHFRDTLCSFPEYRQPSQVWILHTLESKYNEWLPEVNCPQPVFNRSWNFVDSSDAVFKYGYVEPTSEPTPPTNILKDKVGSVLWFVSNCQSDNERLRYVESLANYTDVHIVTRECKFSNPRIQTLSCQDCNALVKEYRFYLGFENSFCEDYITEKPFRGLIFGAVPIVYGGANYSKFLPEHSFIDARKYSPKELGQYLTYLNNNEEEYLKFYSWRRTHKARYTNITEEVCKLCMKVVEWNNTHKTIGTKNDYFESLRCE